MKEIINKFYPNFFNLLRFVNHLRKDFIIRNIHNSNHEQKALLSYIKTPFLKPDNYSHTNHTEATVLAEILNELGYNVDVVDFNSPKIYDLEKYDLLCGFGNTFDNSFKYQTKKTLKRILYSTGFNHLESNFLSTLRAKDVFVKKGKWIFDSIRYVPNSWSFQIHFSDGIISIGNKVAANSYNKNLSNKIFTTPTPLYSFHDFNDILNNKEKNYRNNFLWFGSSGFIHKGLDLLLDFFSKNEHYTLHICGMIGELEFQKLYSKELENPNIINHGFVNIKSDQFRSILLKCGNVIFPSICEGGSPSVLTTIINGALFPVITKNTSFEIPNMLEIDDFKVGSVSKAIERTEKINDIEFKKLCEENAEFALKFHTRENYKKVVKDAITKILN